MFDFVATALACALCLSGCGLSRQDLSALLTEASACQPGDTCVLAGLSRCTCGGAVNAARGAEVDAAAGKVACGGLSVLCAAQTNPRCEDNRCRSDRVQ